MELHERQPRQARRLGQSHAETIPRQSARRARNPRYGKPCQSSWSAVELHTDQHIETTLHKLFAAQRNPPRADHTPPDPVSALPPAAYAAFTPQKSTLHSFWKQLPAPPVRPLIHPIQAMQRAWTSHVLRCDDCEAPLHTATDDMDLEMDHDAGGAVECSPLACSQCSKNVCTMCAVAATSRLCLQCATRGSHSSQWW